MNFSEYFYNIFLEKRNSPKQYVVDQLKKYKDDPDVYISFTMDLGGPKLGLNPKSQYSTPLGIYAYPLKIMWDDIESYDGIPFAKEHPNIFVFKPKEPEKLLYGSDYNYKDLQKDFPEYPPEGPRYMPYAHTNKENEQFFSKRYREIFPNGESRIDRIVEKHRHEHTGEVNYTEVLDYLKYTEFGNYFKYEYNGKYVDFDDTLEGYIFRAVSPNYQKNYAQTFLSICRNKALENPIKWTREILSRGYTGVVDDNGMGIIHTNEPVQAVFFRMRDLKILELIHSKGRQNWTHLERSIREICVNGVYPGSLSLSKMQLKTLPDLSDLTIDGHFLCSHNKLRSLKGSPKKVNGNFHANNNELTNLEGITPEVSGIIDVRNNILPFTDKQIKDAQEESARI